MDFSTKLNIAVLIVNSVAAIFAVVAAIIAVFVYKKTAKLQRDAIGYSILDDRIKIWEYLAYGQKQPEALIKRVLEGRDWELEKFRLLFSQKLVNEYDAIKEYGEKSGRLEGKIDSLERDGLPIRQDGETVNNDDYDRFVTVRQQRKKILEAGTGVPMDDLAAFKTLCLQSFPAEIWKEYYDSVNELLHRGNEQKRMLSSFMEHLHHEVEASVSEGK